MKKYDKYEDWVELIGEDTPEIPKVITGKWLEEQMHVRDRKNMFRMWGFCFSDLSEHEFEENIDPRTIRKIVFSTKTIFPKKHPFKYNENMFRTFENIRKLHEQGIDGTGVNVAVIDSSFEKIPNELKECMAYFKNLHEEFEVNFHGTTVATQLCGKNLGIAPKAKLWFYGAYGGANNIKIDYIEALKDIYEKNKQGANIKIVNISSSRHRENKEFDELYLKLLNQGCYIIDSVNFDEVFTAINQDSNTGEYYFADWQFINNTKEELESKIAIPTCGKMTPLVTTENDYMYYGQASFSWSIPTLAGHFALALQIDPDLTYDEFVELAKETKKKQDGITLINIEGIIEKLNKKQIKK